MPRASIVVPAYNSADTLPATLDSLLAQSFSDFEIIVVNDGSTDETGAVAAAYATDPRVNVVSQANRGLAGARNTGIAAARGEYIGFCDADDLWAREKLAAHVEHLDQNADIGLSYSGSRLIDEEGLPMGAAQRPRLKGVTGAHIFKRNPIGNGSAAVMRRAALRDLAYRPRSEPSRDWVFDETFRQSEDIECWLRLALTTDWQIEGVRGPLTMYRINGNGLSANTDRQLAAWERVVSKLRPLNPEFFKRHEATARTYQLRYLARRAVSALDGDAAWALVRHAMYHSLVPIIEEPIKTVTTFAAAALLRAMGPSPINYAVRLRAGIASR